MGAGNFHCAGRPAVGAASAFGAVSALVGVGMVLSAVFVPMAFFPGSTGVIYRQFSITLVAAMGFSVLVALTLSPAMCAQFLKARPHDKPERGFFRAFNSGFAAFSERYGRAVCRLSAHGRLILAAFAAILAACVFLFRILPTSFLPGEDQGFLNVDITMPPGTTDPAVQQTVASLSEYFARQPEIESFLAVTGNVCSQGNAVMFLKLKPWDERGKDQSETFAKPATDGASAARRYFGKPITLCLIIHLMANRRRSIWDFRLLSGFCKGLRVPTR